MIDLMGQLDDEFKTQTGKSALEDWYNFEEFMASKLVGTDTGNRVLKILNEE